MGKVSSGQTASVRYHSLDSLRATMMLLGLVLHTSLNYVPVGPLGQGWHYQDAQTAPLFDWLIAFIHVFRMPVFFLVSGFFGAYLLNSRGAKAFLRHRWSRIGVPLIVGWAVLLPTMGGAIFYAQKFTAVPPPPTTDLAAMTSEEVSEAISEAVSSDILLHLWFLYHLLLFCVAAAVVAPLVRQIPAHVRKSFLDLFGRTVHRGFIVVLALTSGLILFAMKSWSLDYHGGLVPPPRILATYAMFFFFGWLLHLRRGALEGFKRPAWIHLAAGVGCFLIHRYFVATGCGPGRLCDPTALREHVLSTAFLAPSIWLLTYGFLGLFLRYMEKPSSRWRYLLDASYWMYIVHLPIVMVLPTFLASVALPAIVKFTLVLGAATLLILLAYHYCVRATFIGKQLNGRRYPKSLPVVSPSH